MPSQFESKFWSWRGSTSNFHRYVWMHEGQGSFRPVFRVYSTWIGTSPPAAVCLCRSFDTSDDGARQVQPILPEPWFCSGAFLRRALSNAWHVGDLSHRLVPPSWPSHIAKDRARACKSSSNVLLLGFRLHICVGGKPLYHWRKKSRDCPGCSRKAMRAIASIISDGYWPEPFRHSMGTMMVSRQKFRKPLWSNDWR